MLTRKWTANAKQGPVAIAVTFECPFFDELVSPRGALNSDFEAHALWAYYGIALINFNNAKNNLVYEDELSREFTVATARILFQNTANQHNVRPDKMVNYWPMIHRQRIAMGGKDDLPEQFQFRYWGM